jgi:hypothetical protein
VTLDKDFVECSIKALGKEVVADVQFAEFSLPSVTRQSLRRVFFRLSEYFIHLAKKLIPVAIKASVTVKGSYQLVLFFKTIISYKFK